MVWRNSATVHVGSTASGENMTAKHMQVKVIIAHLLFLILSTTFLVRAFAPSWI